MNTTDTTGHESRSVLERYNFVNEADLGEASARLSDYVASKPTTPTIVPLQDAAGGGRH